QKNLKIYEDLEKLELITIRKYQDRIGIWENYHDVIELNPTQKTIEEFGFEDTPWGAMVMYKKGEIIDVVGISISDNQKEAKAIVKINYVETPFAKLEGNQFRPKQCQEKTTVEKELNFVLYDTGWRLQN